MDRSENPKRPREAADEPKVGRLDAALPSITGQEASSISQRDASKPIGARPRSEVTAHHDAGSGANETVDGLTSAEEAIRRGAEETPVGSPDTELEDLPVFDRGQAPPKA
jgi:hypothetical protein